MKQLPTIESKEFEEILDLLVDARLIATNPKGLRPLAQSILDWHYQYKQELKKKVEEKKVPQKDIDKVDEKYKLIYNSHNETIDMFLKLLEERKE